MSELMARLQADMNASRKAHNKPATLLFGTILADIKYRDIELDRDLTDDDVIEVMRRGIKKRRESIEMFANAKRQELVDKEQAEVTLLEQYLPAAVDPEQIRTAVKAAIAAGAANIGAVMGKVMPQFKGRAEGGAISAIAREELAPKE